MPVSDPDAFRMSIGDHIEELRRRLLLGLLGVAVVACFTLYFGKWIVLWLCQPLIMAQRAAGLAGQTYGFGPATPFTVYLRVSLIGAVVLASPWVLYQLWRFIEVGLYRSERRVMLVLAPFSALMVVLGVLFMYYIMVPICLWFFITFAVSYPSAADVEPTWVFKLLSATQADAPPPPDLTTPVNAEQPFILPQLTTDPPNPVNGQAWLKVPQNELRVAIDGHIRSVPLTTATIMAPLIEIGEYLSFVTWLTLGLVIAFQTPVIMTVAAWSGLTSAQTLARYRRYCIFACFVVGMIFTPSDGVSMLVMSLPLWGLYELGLLVMRFVGRREAEPA